VAEPAHVRRRADPPLGDNPDSKMDQEDLAVYRQVEKWAKGLTGYPR
jgi:hypothetical protein